MPTQPSRLGGQPYRRVETQEQHVDQEVNRHVDRAPPHNMHFRLFFRSNWSVPFLLFDNPLTQ